MRYRVLKRLSTGQRPGQVIDESALAKRAIEALVRVRALSPVAYPPVRVLPGWEARAEQLEVLSITDIGEFLDAETEELAEQLETEPEAIEALKAEALEAVQITASSESSRGCTRCSGR